MISQRRLFPVARVALLVGAVLFVAWPQASTGATASGSCRTRGTTIVANDRARIYALDRGDIEVYACRYSARSIRQHAFLGPRGTQVGISKLRLEGYYAGYLSSGEGCSRSGCIGNIIEITDTRRPTRTFRQRRRLPGSVFALRSDGVFATAVEAVIDMPSIVRVWDRDGAREVVRGNIAPSSLALSSTAAPSLPSLS